MHDKSYNNWTSLSDMALCQIIGNYIKHHRHEQHKTQAELSYAASLSRSTLSLLERGEKVNLMTLIQVLRVLDKLYIMDIFTVNTQISPIALAKLERAQRKRVSKKK